MNTFVSIFSQERQWLQTKKWSFVSFSDEQHFTFLPHWQVKLAIFFAPWWCWIFLLAPDDPAMHNDPASEPDYATASPVGNTSQSLSPCTRFTPKVVRLPCSPNGSDVNTCEWCTYPRQYLRSQSPKKCRHTKTPVNWKACSWGSTWYCFILYVQALILKFSKSVKRWS